MSIDATTPEGRAALRVIAEKATPTEWRREGKRVWPTPNAEHLRRPPVAQCDNTHGMGAAGMEDEANAEYIAAAQPAVVLTLLRLADERDRVVEAARQVVKGHEHFRDEDRAFTRCACPAGVNCNVLRLADALAAIVGRGEGK